MYGLPAYGEMDPTWFIAITYSFIFGAMFGDAGQGLVLLIGGYLLYRFKHIDLAGIISCAGIFSTFFGFMFGSVFGFEDIIEPVWLRPMDAMMNVPFIGKLNTVFIIAIGFGMGIILLCMIFNIMNSLKAKDTEKVWFDTNSVAGLVFYGSAVIVIALFMTGHKLPGGIVLCIMFILPLLVMFLKEPLTNLVEKKPAAFEGGVGMFIVQGFFEMFEVLLSYFSNTLSFVRIGAYAVSHAAMMQVVLMLAGAENGTMGRLVGNEFVSLNLTGRSWKGDTLELALIPGIYRIITTNRLPNGNQFAWEKTFTIKEGGQREETLRLREAQLGDMLERISLPEFEVKDSAGNTVTCAELTKGGKKILMWLEESREPTEHILNEMLEHAEKFHEFENSISFMIRTPEAKQDPLLAKVLKMFPNVSIYYDSFEENIELLGRRMYVDPDKLPLILVTNGESVGIYATSGYNVGTGDMMIRIMEEVPEV